MKLNQVINQYKTKLFPNMLIPEGFDADPSVVEGQRILRSLEAENQNDEASNNSKFIKLEPQLQSVLENIRKRPKTCRIVKYSYGIFIRSGHAFRAQIILVTDRVTGEPMRFHDEKSAKEFAENVMHLTVID